MSGTDRYELLKFDNKTILSFNSKDIDNKSWYLPNCDSLGNTDKQIAIEFDIVTMDKSHMALNDDPLLLQSGELLIAGASRYKILFKIMVNSEFKSFVLLCPSWGRWLKKPGWLIIGIN